MHGPVRARVNTGDAVNVGMQQHQPLPGLSNLTRDCLRRPTQHPSTSTGSCVLAAYTHYARYALPTSTQVLLMRAQGRLPLLASLLNQNHSLSLAQSSLMSLH